MSAAPKMDPGPRPKVDYRPGWYKNLPAEMVQRPQWVLWKYELKKSASGEKKWTKVPYRAFNPNVKASTTDPATWSSFEKAVNAFQKNPGKVDGIGYVFSPDDPYTGMDVDNCLDPATGELKPWARRYVEPMAPTFADISPSRTGIKFVAVAKLAGTGTKQNVPGGAVEQYDQGRFFTLTGMPFGRPENDGPFPVGIIVDRQEFIAAIYAELKVTKTKRKAAGQAGTSRASQPNDLSDDALIEKIRASKQGPKFTALFDRGDLSGHRGDASSADFALCCILGFWTGKDEARVDRIFRRSALMRDKWDERRGEGTYGSVTVSEALAGVSETYSPHVETRVGPRLHDPEDRQCDGGNDGPGSGEPDGPGDEPARLPEIEVHHVRHLVVAAALDALADDPDLYRRGDSLVTVVKESKNEVALTGKTIIKGTVGTPRIITLSDANVGCRITKCAQLYEMKKTKGGETFPADCHPPEWLIRSVSTRKHYPGIRNLAAVAECPFPRPDGTIVETPGYDAETETLYLPSIDFLPIPNSPTREDARDAWGRISNYFREFPYATDDDRVVTLMGILTVIARQAIPGPVPGIVVNGNKAGTGKGLKIDCMAIPGTGRGVPTSNYPEEKEEAVKVKVAIAMSGDQAVHFDNLEEGATYGSGPMDGALTSTVTQDRVLGGNDRPILPLRPAWFISGNNLSPGKDAHRRWAVCNLVTKLERPEEREVEQENLRAIVKRDRALIVRDALTILKAHSLAGRPKGKWAPLGSFEEWDQVVRAAVWFATDHDCLATQRQAAVDAPERQKKIALLLGWQELPEGGADGRGITAAKAVSLVAAPDGAVRYPTLYSAMIQYGRAGKLIDSRPLGYTLRGLSRQKIAGMTLESPGEEHKTTLWRVIGAYSDTPKPQATPHPEGGDDGDGGDVHTPPRTEKAFDSDMKASESNAERNGERGPASPPSPSSPPRVPEADGGQNYGARDWDPGYASPWQPPSEPVEPEVFEP